MLRRIPIRTAKLRVNGDGFRYVSLVLSLDLTPVGIVMQDAKTLSPDAQIRLLQVIDTVALDLGFAPSGQGPGRQWPKSGEAVAALPRVPEQGETSVEVLPQAVVQDDDPQSVDDLSQTAPGADDATSEAEEGDDPGFDM